MIHIKNGVRLHGIKPEIVLAIIVCSQIYDSVAESLVVTSVIDGEHMRASIHYVGGAFDMSLPRANAEKIRQRIAGALGGDFDVVLEDDHIHVEWQPKEPY